MKLPVIKSFLGKNDGPTTTIMAGVHGNEKAGVIALLGLYDSLYIDAGRVNIIIANPEAIDQGVRYIEKNMNRCFIDGLACQIYEERCAKEIIPYLKKSDFLLDLHNTIGDISEPFIISENPKRSKYFNVKRSISGLDNLHVGGSDGYMNIIGKIGLCLECGSISDANAPLFAEVSILNFLMATGNVLSSPELYKDQQFINCEYIYITISKNFKLVEQWSDFQKLSKGTIIAYDGSISVVVPYDGYILFAHNRSNIGEEGFVFGKAKL